MKKYLFSCIFLTLAAAAFSLDFSSHPEAADKNSLFVNIQIGRYILPDKFDFNIALSFDYMLPIFPPLSLGFFMQAPYPNLTSFGPRIAYHPDLDVENADFFFIYCFDFGFLRNHELENAGYKDPIPVHLYDFRLGVHYFFGSMLAAYVETGYKLQSVNIGVSIKLY
ncbi:MAG: hypothetical protein LBV68_07000 [Spirochaetaceae bacterium]|jgi:hypothetical protein|nr:hypothetical protein [Spirochaetaceae bacterium]